jgi:hypothetical protein
VDFDCAAETWHLIYHFKNNVGLKIHFDFDIDIDIDIFVNCNWVVARWQ